MQKIARIILGAVAATAALVAVAATMALNPGPVALVCDAAKGVPAGQRDALCDALAEVLREQLAQALPVRELRRGAPETPDAPSVTLTVTEAKPHYISARLAWRDGPRRGDGGPLSSIVVDGTLTRPWYLSLSRNLLKTSGFGL